jgi:hypothetical protein
VNVHGKIPASLKTIIIKNQTFKRKTLWLAIFQVGARLISLESWVGCGQVALP